MLERPKISVVVLIYNVEQYIGKCVESLFNQSFDSVEFIFIDDCSTDRSIEILNRLMLQYPERAKNSKVIRNETNQGQAKSRIIGINEANGQYIIACDSDDFVDTNAYKELYNYIEATNSDIVACDFFRKQDKRLSIESYTEKDTPTDWIKNILLSKKMGSLWNHLIRKELLENIISPISNIMEDNVILIQSILKSRTVSTYKKPLYYYRFRSDSITNNTNNVTDQANQMYANLVLIKSLLNYREGGENQPVT